MEDIVLLLAFYPVILIPGGLNSSPHSILSPIYMPAKVKTVCHDNRLSQRFFNSCFKHHDYNFNVFPVLAEIMTTVFFLRFGRMSIGSLVSPSAMIN